MIHEKLPGFPENFLWGASTSAYQFEGGDAEDGKGRSVQDLNTPNFATASDHYHRFREDVELMAKLGLKAYRFSISWSRILPEGTGRVNEKGLAFYEALVDELLAHDITPVATLYHFDLPLALYGQGGWSKRSTIDAFVEFARIMYERLGSKTRYWLTINEQNVMIVHPAAMNPGKIPSQKELYQQSHNMFVASARATKLLHEMCPDDLIGPAPNITAIYPRTCKPEDVIAADNWESIRCWLYLDMAVYGRPNALAASYLADRGWLPVAGEGDEEILSDPEARPDYLGCNYYATATVSAPRGDGTDRAPRAGDQQVMLGEEGVYRAAQNPELSATEYGWIIDPVGLRTTLRRIESRYHLPILITENGMGAREEADADGVVHDQYRIDYLTAHMQQAELAIADGVNLIGYCPWAFADLVSTHNGFAKRYGFVRVDQDDTGTGTFARTPKDSFWWYSHLIETNGQALHEA